MKKEILFLLFISCTIQFSQPIPVITNTPQLLLEEPLNRKILSHKLVEDVRHGLLNNLNRLNADEFVEEEKIGIAIYFDNFPTSAQINELEQVGITCYLDTWIPPLENHPYGFILAKLPPSKLENVLAKPYVKKMDSSTHEAYPNNNRGTLEMVANSVWLEGFDGTGVKVAILDSGLDDAYDGTDLPSSYEKKDYWDFPDALDDDVANAVSGHGTHVTGSVLGRGTLSAANTANGGGAYKGTAPGADLVFLKIGGDATSSSTSDAMIGAMQAAVNVYDADILSMSYGGWYDHHDGSSLTEQTVDWVYAQGKPFFLSAGNSGDDGRHYSGTVNANGSTAYIQVNVSGVPTSGTYKLLFNLVWQDGLGTSNDLWLLFYDNSYTYLSTLTYGQYESPRGTESEYLVYDNPLITDGTYYIRVINASSNNQDFHIYEAWNGGKVRFQNPDPDYTIGQPASADHGFAVGAYTTREYWTASDGSSYYFPGWFPEGEISYFSSRGPRIDGHTKPDITAPGALILSLRDTDVYTSFSTSWVDNDGTIGPAPYEADANYYRMQGTSMACPLAAGAAALFLQYFPGSSPQDVYDALMDNAATDSFTGGVPNNTFGWGKLNIYDAIFNSQLAVDISVYLEGAYDLGTDNMTTNLDTDIPLGQPFNTSPWNYGGSESVSSIPSDITDWVLVELRSNETTVISRKAAFLRNDGLIVDLNGFSFKITGTSGDYFIAVHHRNHLSVMSSSKVSLSNIILPPLALPKAELKNADLVSY